MPGHPALPCTHPGCGNLSFDGKTACVEHRVAWRKNGFTNDKRLRGRKLDQRRKQLFRRQPLCVMCEKTGRITVATIRDHIIPLAEGGSDDESNTQALCVACHDVKSREEAIRGKSSVYGNTANATIAIAYAEAKPSGQVLPYWLPAATIPVTVVTGPPGSGKSTYVAAHAGPDDLVLDIDVIASRLTGRPPHSKLTGDEIGKALDVRNVLLAECARAFPLWPAAWLIVTATTSQALTFWRGKYNNVITLDTPRDVCAERINADSTRSEEAKRYALHILTTAVDQKREDLKVD